MTALPRIVICHRGRALGLHLMGRTGPELRHAETSAVIALREAGMRIEVARGLEQALLRVREMGVALKDDDKPVCATITGARRATANDRVFQRHQL